MQTLSSEHEVQLVSGGFGAYDVGNSIGSAVRSGVLLFAQMGSMYTPML